MTEAVCPYVIDTNGSDLHGETTRLREQGPIARIELPDGVLAWTVHGYEVAKQILGDERFSKDPRRSWPAYMNGDIAPGWALITWAVMDNMATHDGEDHARLRRLLLKAFTARRVEAMKPTLEALVQELLDRMDTAGPGDVVDLRAGFTQELPTRMMCDLFGVPAERRAEVLQGGHVNVDTRITSEIAEANVEQWTEAITDLVAYKREHPADDLTSALIAAKEEDGSRLSDTEMLGTLHLLLGAGSETLVNGLSHSVLALLTDPQLRADVDSGKLPWSDVFEEALRVESPVGHLPFRFATEDVEIGGVTIAKGDVLLVNFAGIGRDPDVHVAADQFDASRMDKSHLSFGFGVHYCLGAQLAKMAAMIGLPALFERFPDLQLAVDKSELEPQGSFIVNGYRTIPVRLKSRVTAS